MFALLLGVFGVVLGAAAVVTTGAGEGANFGQCGENPVGSELNSIVEEPKASSTEIYANVSKI